MVIPHFMPTAPTRVLVGFHSRWSGSMSHSPRVQGATEARMHANGVRGSSGDVVGARSTARMLMAMLLRDSCSSY